MQVQYANVSKDYLALSHQDVTAYLDNRVELI